MAKSAQKLCFDTKSYKPWKYDSKMKILTRILLDENRNYRFTDLKFLLRFKPYKNNKMETVFLRSLL